MDEAVRIEPAGTEETEELKKLDNLRGKKWVNEVLRMRKPYAESVLSSKAKVDAAKKEFEQHVEALNNFEEKLMPRMRNRRPLLLRRFRSVVKSPDGEIRIFNKKKVLDMEGADADEILEVLESIPEGRKAVRIKKEIDKESLKQRSARLLQKLEPYKVYVGQMFYVSIKSTGEKSATNLVRERRKK